MSKLETAVRGLAAANPTFIYNPTGRLSCSYLPDASNPMGCIMGAALRAVGVPDAVIDNLEESAITNLGTCIEDMSFETSRAAIDALGFRPFDDDLDWYSAVQDAQDQGLTWSQAVGFADDGGHSQNPDHDHLLPGEWLEIEQAEGRWL